MNDKFYVEVVAMDGEVFLADPFDTLDQAKQSDHAKSMWGALIYRCHENVLTLCCKRESTESDWQELPV